MKSFFQLAILVYRVVDDKSLNTIHLSVSLGGSEERMAGGSGRKRKALRWKAAKRHSGREGKLQ